MRTRLVCASVALCFALGCSRSTPAGAVSSKPQTTSPPTPAPPPAAAPTAPPAPTPASAPAPTPVAVVAAPLKPEGPPRKVVKGSGISITETSDGRVILKTTATWGEAIDTTYSDCSYYSAAIPVLKTQLAPTRAKLLARVCTNAAAKPMP